MVDWLKVLHTFPRNPRLRDIMRGLGTRDKDSATGFALRWLIYVDEQTTDGRTGLLPAELDEELNRKNGTRALLEAGWAVLDESGHVCAVEFDKHCGDTAKKRAEDARRQAESRMHRRAKRQRGGGDLSQNPVTPVTDVSQENVTPVTENALPEEEEEYKFRNKTGILGEDAGRYNQRVRAASARPSHEEEVRQVMKGNPACPMSEAELEACARAFYLDKEAVGWVTPKGLPISNWRAAAMRYQHHWQDNLHANPSAHGGTSNRNNNCNRNRKYE